MPRCNLSLPESFSSEQVVALRRNLKAVGASVVLIRFKSVKFSSLRRDEVDHAAYSIARLLAGKGTAESEWTHLGMKIVVRPDDGGGLRWVKY